jgi:hypothetical protein
MTKRLLQAVILTILIKILAAASSPSFPNIASASVSHASKNSVTLLYRWVDSMSDRLIQEIDHLH